MTSPLTDFTSILARWEAERPDDIALSYGGVDRTWTELARRVRRNAAAQRAAGLVPGDRVAVLDLNHPSCLELTLACAQVGTANAVVNFRLAPPEIVYVDQRRAAPASCSSARSSPARSSSCARSCPPSSA